MWRKVLEEMGFTNVSLIPDEAGEGILAQQALFLSCAPPLFQKAKQVQQGVWLILSDHQGVGHELCTALVRSGEQVTQAFAGEKFGSYGPGSIRLIPLGRRITSFYYPLLLTGKKRALRE